MDLQTEHERKTFPLRAAAWMTAAQVAFAAMAVAARVGGKGLPWQEVCASRFVVGTLTAFGAARVQGHSLRLSQQRAAFWRSFYGTLSAAGTFLLYATPALPVGDAVTLLATAPLFVALLSAPLLGEPIRMTVLFALIGGFGGIGLVAQPSFGTNGHLIALATATAAASAMAFIWLRRVGPSESSEAVVFHFGCVGSVTMTLACVPVWRTPDAHAALALLATGLCGGLGQIAMTRAYALDRAARVSVLGYSGVVFARVLAALVFGEVPNEAQAGGSLLVAGSGVLLVAGDGAWSSVRRRLRGEPRPVSPSE